MTATPATHERVRAGVTAQPATSQVIADRLGVSVGHARRILNELVIAGVVQVTSGEGGTYEWQAR